MRDDPTTGVDAALVVRIEVGTATADARDVVSVYGSLERETRFGNLHATVPESDVAAVLGALPDGVAAVETQTSVADDPGHEG